jgi:hypothetical protein
MFAEPRENTTLMLLHSLPQKRASEEFAEQRSVQVTHALTAG